MVAKRSSQASSAAVHASRPRETERRGYLLLIEADEAAPQNGRHRGVGTNGVYENDFVRTAASTGRQCHMRREGLAVL